MKPDYSKLILTFILALGVLPVFAGISGNVSKSNFYDIQKTIMTDLPNDNSIITGKYWGKNLLYPNNKYKPLFMLSNKDLLNLNPEKKVKLVKRVSIPSIYNISLKTASIQSVSLKQEAKDSSEIDAILEEYSDTDLISLYEKSKNPDTDMQTKIDTAILLKDSNEYKNYKLAMNLLDDVIKIEPYNAYAYYLKGELYSIQNSPESAMKNYVQALKINPTSKECLNGIARLLEPTNTKLAQKYYEMARN